jgi:Fur family ferric uptake transcriptional regulator
MPNNKKIIPKERVTPIRTALLEILSKTKKPLTTQEILTALLKKKISANKTTVYRQLESLKENHLVTEVYFNDRNTRYELEDEKTHHHHLVCLKCKKVEDVTLPEDLHHQEKLVLKKNKCKVLQNFLEFFGLCKNCQK